ncbi:MAG: hypothetical protein JSW43_06430 [Gemmatimonadota bacterium]|nr:MAG: hypothetical protein JSW43_06430 [Gemmatimonadota bacterium]
MTDLLLLAEDRLLQGLAAEARGPKRNGLYALWLFLRQCDGRLPPGVLSERADRARLERLEKRLSSLSLPAPLRRALPGSVRELKEGRADGIAVGLQQLVAPAREALGRGAADAVALAARSVREAMRVNQGIA